MWTISVVFIDLCTCTNPTIFQPQNRFVDGFEEIGEWDNKMAHGMLPLDQECEAFGEKMPERCNVSQPPGDD